MKKRLLTILELLVSVYSYGQSVYMHEAQQDAEESGATGFSGIFSLLVFFVLIYIACKIWKYIHPHKKDVDYTRKQPLEDDNYNDDDEWERKEREDEQWELQLMNMQRDENIIRENPTSYNSLDLSPVTKQNTVHNRKTYEDIVLECAQKQIDGFFPKGSIEERLNNVSKEDYVDLGLSVMWCSKNVGASKIYDLGHFFRWGSLDYLGEFNKERILDYAKIPYSKDIEYVEIDISGNSNYDAAYKFSNGAVRMPTKLELEELLSQCSWEYIEIDKYKGYIITGPSGKSIYLPLRYDYFVNYMSEVMMTVIGSYKSSTPDLENKYGYEDKGAFSLFIVNKNHNTKEFDIHIGVDFKNCFQLLRGVAISN